MNLLKSSILNDDAKRRYEAVQNAPVTVLQIGEGNFLRGFFDWMISECHKQGLFSGSIAVVQPRPSGKEHIRQLADQDGLYTLVIRGVEEGSPTSKQETISVFSEMFDPYTQWDQLLQLAVSPHLSLVVSNTTEAGLTYSQEALGDGPILSFPGKITFLLYLRYQAFNGSSEYGLTFLPCELLERNGDLLRHFVIMHAKDWDLPQEFMNWVTKHNRFLNSLVDRIVTGYPEQAEAEAWFEEWGMRDKLLCTAEPYHLWAIEGGADLEEQLPFRKAGLNVHFTNDLKPFQERKVRILNGAHTWMATLGLIHGVDHVREILEHPELGQQIHQVVMNEILPSLPYAEEELQTYASNVFERFANPYIRHRLENIAMNSLSKFQARLLPTLAYYQTRGEVIPECLILGFAGLLRYYRVEQITEGCYAGKRLDGEIFTVKDSLELLKIIADIWQTASIERESTLQTIRRLLAEERLWGGQSLAEWNGLADGISLWFSHWEGENRK